MTSGVPQDSVLWPILFLLNINDLPQNLQSQVRLFADDTTVYLTVTSSEDANTLQVDLYTLQEWEPIWDMEFIQVSAKYSILHCPGNRSSLNTPSTVSSYNQ